MIKIENLCKTFHHEILKDVNVEINQGDVISIIGPSGCGKSTFLRCINQLEKPTSGHIYLDGVDLTTVSKKELEKLRQKMGMVFQSFNLFEHMTVIENIMLGPVNLLGVSKQEAYDEGMRLLKTVGLSRKAMSYPDSLSGGQKQRVAIARALAQETPIILADEPTGNLDKKSSESVLKLLHDISKNKLVIVVTHNYDQIEKYTTRKIVMHDGRVMEDKKIRDYIKVEKPKISNNKDIRSLSKLRLGLRNTFNIIPKFLLILSVYIFIIYAMFFAYSSFKYAAYEESLNGYNPFFSNKDENRIVIKKKNGEEFTEEDYKKIEKIDNVDSIMKNDLALDNEI